MSVVSSVDLEGGVSLISIDKLHFKSSDEQALRLLPSAERRYISHFEVR